MTTNDGPPEDPNKKRKISEAESSDSQTPRDELALVSVSKTPPANNASASTAPTEELLLETIERLVLTVNPTYLQGLQKANILGYERPVAARVSQARFYEIEIVNFRNSLTALMKSYLTIKYYEIGKLPPSKIAAEIEKIAPICADACMTALYAKLRSTHKSYGKYASRYTTPHTYTKELELPLPFADAIQNFGSFETSCLKQNFIMIPTYPEGVRHEGRSKEDWHSYEYESYMPILRECGIPLKSVDTRLRNGTAWWTYRIVSVLDSFDIECILPYLHYTDHSAVCASMFFTINEREEVLPVIKHLTDDADYGTWLRALPGGIQLRAFMALCHRPSEEWNFDANID